VRLLRPALVLFAVIAGARAAAPVPATYVVTGELARVSLARGSVTVKIPGPPLRELELRVAADTAISSRGRPLRLPDLRPGDRITAACADDAAGVHHAERIKLARMR